MAAHQAPTKIKVGSPLAKHVPVVLTALPPAHQVARILNVRLKSPILLRPRQAACRPVTQMVQKQKRVHQAAYVDQKQHAPQVLDFIAPTYPRSAVLTNNAPTPAVNYPTLLPAPASRRIAHPTTVLFVMLKQNPVRQEIAAPMP